MTDSSVTVFGENGGSIVLSGRNDTEAFQFLAQKTALKLELKGLAHSSGRSIYAHVKRVYGLSGSRESVLAQMEALAERVIRREVTVAELRAAASINAATVGF